MVKVTFGKAERELVLGFLISSSVLLSLYFTDHCSNSSLGRGGEWGQRSPNFSSKCCCKAILVNLGWRQVERNEKM
jgi:hypothetical protein